MGLDRLLGVSHLFCSQQAEPIDSDEFSVVILVSKISSSFRDDCERRKLTIGEDQPGVHRVTGGVFDTWVLESYPLIGESEPVFSVFSEVFPRDPKRIIDLLGPESRHIATFMFQQIGQFQNLGRDFEMQHTETDRMKSVYAELAEIILPDLTIEQRLRGVDPQDDLQTFKPEERLQGLKPEERIQGLQPEERIQGLQPEERLRGMTVEERRRLRELLEGEAEADAN